MGFGHCGVGLEPRDGKLPSYDVPAFRNVGANEFLVDVTHGAVDFLSGGSTSPLGELNMWYHSLNCGFRAAFVGETDWPCITDERVGGGRTYVRLQDPPRGDAGYGAWVTGIRGGRLYMGDGRSHALEFEVGGAGAGEELRIGKPGIVRLRSLLAALLAPEDTPAAQAIRASPWWRQPSWHLERARIAGSRGVMLEIIVNGAVRATQVLAADGRLARVDLDLAISGSSWIALRILGSLHTHTHTAGLRDRGRSFNPRVAKKCILVRGVHRYADQDAAAADQGRGEARRRSGLSCRTIHVRANRR